MKGTERAKMSVLIFEGMKVGVLDGDATISVDEAGNPKAEIIISTSYNVVPLWLKTAYQNIELAHKASKKIASDWGENEDKQKLMLIEELIPSMQVFVACGIALDALYEMLRPHANINQQDIQAWKDKKTARSAQIAEIIRRVYRLDNSLSKKFKHNIKSIVDFRDQAVHPTHIIKRVCSRPDIPVDVDWRFAAYRYSNSEIAYRRTMEMLLALIQKRSANSIINESMENVSKSLIQLGLVKE